MSSTSLFPLLISSLFFFFVRCVPETSQVFRAHFFTSNASRCVVFECLASLRRLLLLYTSTRSSWLYIQRAFYFISFSSLFSRGKRKIFFRGAQMRSSLDKKILTLPLLVSGQFWINIFQRYSHFSLSLARVRLYSSAESERDRENKDTHTHTHTQRERERGFKKNVPVVFVFSADDNTNNVIFI